MRLGQFSAHVSVGGVPLTEYAPERSGEGTQASCWIASETGKQFRVEWTNTQASEAHPISGLLIVDGNRYLGKVMKPPNALKPGFTTAFRDSVSTSETERRPFVFGSVILTDDDEYLNADVSPHLGTISLGIYEVRCDRPQACMADNKPGTEVKVVHERLKTGVPHSVHFGAELTGRLSRKTSTSIVSKLVTFVFKYRPIELLRAEGIVPRVQPALGLPVEVVDLTMDTDEEDVDEEGFEMMEIESQLRPTPEPALLKKKRKRMCEAPTSRPDPNLGPSTTSGAVKGGLKHDEAPDMTPRSELTFDLTMTIEEEDVKAKFESMEIELPPSLQSSPRKRKKADPEPLVVNGTRKDRKLEPSSELPSPTNAIKHESSESLGGAKGEIKHEALDGTKPKMGDELTEEEERKHKPELESALPASMKNSLPASFKREGPAKKGIKAEAESRHGGEGLSTKMQLNVRHEFKHEESTGGVKRDLEIKGESSALKSESNRDSADTRLGSGLVKEVKYEGGVGRMKTNLSRPGRPGDRLKRKPLKRDPKHESESSLASSPGTTKKKNIAGAVKAEIKNEASLVGMKKERIPKREPTRRDSLLDLVKEESKTGLKGTRPMEVIDLTV